MSWQRRHSWLAALGIVAALGVGTAYWRAYELSREPPRYSQIEQGLWLGASVKEPPPGTRSVLNLCEVKDSYEVESHRWEPIPDAEPAQTFDWLRRQIEFIDSERAAGRPLYVHCANGVSRSAAVVTAYLMQREHWSRDQTLDFLRSRRPGVYPSPVFMRLLLEWEQSLERPEGSVRSAG